MPLPLSPPPLQNVAKLRFPLLLCESLKGARILRGVAALLHMEFCKPTERYVVSRCCCGCCCCCVGGCVCVCSLPLPSCCRACCAC